MLGQPCACGHRRGPVRSQRSADICQDVPWVVQVSQPPSTGTRRNGPPGGEVLSLRHLIA